MAGSFVQCIVTKTSNFVASTFRMGREINDQYSIAAKDYAIAVKCVPQESTLPPKINGKMGENLLSLFNPQNSFIAILTGITGKAFTE